MDRFMYELTSNEVYFASFMGVIMLTFFFGLKYWYNRTKLWILPSLIYWVLGLVVVCVTIDSILSLFLDSPITAVVDLGVYITLGLMYFKPKKPKP
jgi:hypothetical protein|tara:strand:+ start:726 stop:1013 length:288 start_codon:yes stop_codon:yes gene_type:complete